MDQAFSKRLRCINFPTEFCEYPKNNTQKLINTNINEKFDNWKSDFMLILIEYFKKYMKEKKLIVTQNILKWTNKYKEDTDVYLLFINECTKKADIHIRTSILYEAFKNWFSTNNPGIKMPSNKEFIRNIKKYKEVVRIRDRDSGVNGIKFLDLTEEYKSNF